MLVLMVLKRYTAIKSGDIIANTAWAVYNVCDGLYIILIMRAMTVGSNLIAYIKRRKELSKNR